MHNENNNRCKELTHNIDVITDSQQNDSQQDDEQQEESIIKHEDGVIISTNNPITTTTTTDSLPILKINILKLCGYIPKTKKEYDIVCNEIKVSLFGKQEQYDNDISSIDFYKRSSELLESNIAIHSDTNAEVIIKENDDHSNSWCNISYPEYITIFDNEHDTTKPTNIIHVSTIWKQIQSEINNNPTKTKIEVLIHRIIK